MPTEPLKLFYCYARADARLRKRLDEHLTLLTREQVLSEWYDGEIVAGQAWEEEIHQHLRDAHIILLLVSAAFLASDYCYDVEMKKALERHEEGTARVIPVILRDCDWKIAPLNKLQALPGNAKPVTMWTNKDAAFADVARGIRKAAETLHENPFATDTPPVPRKKRVQKGMVAEERVMIDTPTAELDGSTLTKPINRYLKEISTASEHADYELGLRAPFQNLLTEVARLVGWHLVPEQPLENNIRPDGVLRDTNNLRRGYWEAKGPAGNLNKEIHEKINKGYPLTNTIFENTIRAVLYQNDNKFAEYDLRKFDDVYDLLIQFFTHTEPHIERFQTAVIEFKKRIPALANDLLGIIDDGHKKNPEFQRAFASFAEICRTSLNPNLSDKAIDEMLVQHLLTERLFRTVFNNPDFVNRNIIAAEIEKVIYALTIHSFNRQDFFQRLDRYYVAIEGTAQGITSWTERQEFLNTVYEGFFQGFSVKQADVHGIVYTPQEIVDFMCASVEEVLKREFDLSIADPGVKILDPATGTGNFIVNLIRHHIPGRYLQEKYKNDLFCNEITLLPYYIASLNIEHEYYAKMGEYEPFEGICFADTLELAEGQQLSLFVEKNTERVQREKDAQIMVVIGNPPYNVGQLNENDNNKNRKYPIIDGRIHETYAKASKASNKNALSDVYVKFFRWATDRLAGRDGIVCLVTNNSFVDQIAFDGMRQYLQRDFTQIYHLDLHGNVRKNPKLSGTTHNVFGIQVGVGITIAVRSTQNPKRAIYYYRVPEYWRKAEKLGFLQENRSIANINWQELRPDERYSWITEGLHTEFPSFLPLGTKEAKTQLLDAKAIFRTYSGGVKTNRDTWVYDFSFTSLVERSKHFIEVYNSEVDRWRRRGDNTSSVDDFVIYDDTKIKWSRDLKLDLQRGHYAEFKESKLRVSLCRPFCKQWLFFDRILNEEVYQLPQFFPTVISETENIGICLSAIGTSKSFHCLAVDCIPDIHLTGDTQCFPYYTYSEDGTNRRENITDWALQQFQTKYGPDVTKWDIFHYVYGILHHPQYRERYAENLKRDLPHIPFLHTAEAFFTCVNIGKQLMDLHINYEQAKEYKKLDWIETKGVPLSYTVEKMRLSTDKRVVVVNESLRLGPVPPECFEYRLGNRSALEWIIDQYQVSEDKRSGIKSDPNRYDDPTYIVRLVGKVVTVSVETVRLVKEIAQAVKMEDWLPESVEVEGTHV